MRAPLHASGFIPSAANPRSVGRAACRSCQQGSPTRRMEHEFRSQRDASSKREPRPSLAGTGHRLHRSRYAREPAAKRPKLNTVCAWRSQQSTNATVHLSVCHLCSGRTCRLGWSSRSQDRGPNSRTRCSGNLHAAAQAIPSASEDLAPRDNEVSETPPAPLLLAMANCLGAQSLRQCYQHQRSRPSQGSQRVCVQLLGAAAASCLASSAQSVYATRLADEQHCHRLIVARN
mmetsp:Transcript_23741/g.49709  ORF Transcript_23741/g.49709 Transcript_23741/m.49709 type:complete len:232 (+) Transcript_23741:437-1132(+)